MQHHPVFFVFIIKTIMLRSVNILLGLLLFIGAFPQDAQDKKQQIDSLLEAYTQADCFSGVVLVKQKDEVLYRKAWGMADRELSVPMAPEMKFKIGSVSKPFTAVLILQLVEEGLISLEGKITDYLPDYKGVKGDCITIQQLLNHTSGILNSLDPDDEAIQERLHHSLDEMVSYAEASALYFEPCTHFHYSNLGYALLARIAERVTHSSYDSLLAERIFKPLGMQNTRQYASEKIEPMLAKGYEFKLLSGYENAGYIDPSYARGAGGLISTADDLSKFDEALHSGRLIAENLYRQMISPDPKSPFGLGWELSTIALQTETDTLAVISHSGSINGFGSYMAHIEKDSLLIIVLKNSRADTYIHSAFAPGIGREIVAILYNEDVVVPKKSIAREIGPLIGQEGVQSAIQRYYAIKGSTPTEYSMEEAELNKLGIELLFRYDRPEEALEIFRLNMNEFPDSYNTYDSYAYVLRQQGDLVNSIQYYKKGLQVLNDHPRQNSSGSVRKDAENARTSIQEMESELSIKNAY